MSLPFSEWNVSLKKLTEKYPEEQFSPILRKITLSALRGVVLRSPVGNPSLWKHPAPPGYVGGHFRNNWFVDIQTINSRIRDSIDKTGAASLAEGKKVDNLTNPFVIIYLHNSLPYARRLEYGWSTQAPQGMVSITAQSISKIVR